MYFNQQIFTNEQCFSEVSNLLHRSQKNVFFFRKLRRARPDRNRCSRLNSSDFE
jgi:hypothetical protein